jgi:hypothetical protein
MADPSELVPTFSLETDAGVDAAGRLDAFAVEHGVDDAVRARLADVTAAVLDRVPEPALVEADIDQGSLQLAVSSDLGSPAAEPDLAGLGDACDGFSVARRGPAIEIWICFRLG